MKLRGKFIIRQIMDDIVAVPVGSYALEFNGMIVLNPVSRLIWETLESEVSFDTILQCVTDRFDVSAEEAAQDISEFLDQLRRADLLNESEHT